MKAAVLAAGLGTRLRPLTYTLPKALFPVLNLPVLGLILDRLITAGFTRVAVNTHHLAPLVHRFLEDRRFCGIDLRISHEPELLGTGGGLRELGKLLERGPFLAVNSDVLTDLDFREIFQGHRQGALTTLVVHDCPPYNNVWVEGHRVVAIGGDSPGGGARPLAYTGVQVVSAGMLDYLPKTGGCDLVAAWRQALTAGEPLAALALEGHFWQDLGTREGYLSAHRRLLAGAAPGLARFFPDLTDPYVGPHGAIGSGVDFAGGVCLGAGVQVGAGAFLKNTVVWEQAYIGPGVRLEDCLVAAGARVTEPARGRTLV